MYNTEETQVQGNSKPGPQNLPGNRGHEKTGYSYSIGAPKNDLAKIRQVLGEQAVLVPFERRKKKAKYMGWLETTIEETRNPGYIRLLESNNVAVLVGEKSGGLVTIDFDDEDFMADFSRQNPKLSAETLSTTGYRGCNLWFRIIGDYPASVQIIKELGGASVGEFRGGRGGTTIAGVHPEGCTYTMNGLRPLVIRFEDIVWPEGYNYPWMRPTDEEIAAQVGPAYEEKNGRVTRINAAYFAELVMACRYLVFEETVNSFYFYDGKTGLWDKKTANAMAECAWEVCLEWIDRQDKEIRDSLKLQFGQRTRTDIVAMLKSKTVAVDFFTSGPFHLDRHLLFHTLDGMIRCCPDEGEEIDYQLLPHDEEYRSRFRFPCRYIENPQCPRFDSLMVSAFGEEDVPYVLKVLGYLMIDGNPGQRAVVIKGPGGDGKSQLALVLQGLFANGSWGQLRTAHLDGRFEIGSYADKRGVAGLDVGSDFLCLEGAKNLKALTGGDTFVGEMKFSNDRVHVKGDKQVLITTNHVLRLVAGGDIEAWRRRLIVFEARKCQAETLIVNFAEVILSEERDAVFSKLMNAGYEASVELKRDGRLTIPQRFCLGGCSGVVVLGDVGMWVGERIRPGEASYSTKDLLFLYSEWCRSRGEHPTSRTVFEKSVARLLEDLGIESSHSLRGSNNYYCNGYRGLEVGP